MNAARVWRSLLAVWLITLGVTLAGTALAGKVYKWVDADGHTQFSDHAPDAAQAKEITIPTFTEPTELASIPGNAGGRGIKLYTTARCGYCKRARAYLASRGLAYTEFDVETSSVGRADYARLKGRGVPIIFVGDQRMDGYTEAGFAQLLQNAGY